MTDPHELSKRYIDQLEEYIEGEGYEYERVEFKNSEGEQRDYLDIYVPGVSREVVVRIFGYADSSFPYSVGLSDDRGKGFLVVLGAVAQPERAMLLYSQAIKELFRRCPEDHVAYQKHAIAKSFEQGSQEGL